MSYGWVSEPYVWDSHSSATHSYNIHRYQGYLIRTTVLTHTKSIITVAISYRWFIKSITTKPRCHMDELIRHPYEMTTVLMSCRWVSKSSVGDNPGTCVGQPDESLIHAGEITTIYLCHTDKWVSHPFSIRISKPFVGHENNISMPHGWLRKSSVWYSD